MQAALDAVERSVTAGRADWISATVTSAEIEASNGVIHVIDTVLLPK